MKNPFYGDRFYDLSARPSPESEFITGLEAEGFDQPAIVVIRHAATATALTDVSIFWRRVFSAIIGLAAHHTLRIAGTQHAVGPLLTFSQRLRRAKFSHDEIAAAWRWAKPYVRSEATEHIRTVDRNLRVQRSSAAAALRRALGLALNESLRDQARLIGVSSVAIGKQERCIKRRLAGMGLSPSEG